MIVVWSLIAVVAVLAVYFLVRIRGRRRDLVKEAPKPDEIRTTLERLQRELTQAEKAEDAPLVREIELQIRVQEHWLRKYEAGDESWREFYEKSSGNLLDEWGKTGSR